MELLRLVKKAWCELGREVAAEGQVRHEIIMCNPAGLWQAIHGFYDFTVDHVVAYFILELVILHNVRWK